MSDVHTMNNGLAAFFGPKKSFFFASLLFLAVVSRLSDSAKQKDPTNEAYSSLLIGLGDGIAQR